MLYGSCKQWLLHKNEKGGILNILYFFSFNSLSFSIHHYFNLHLKCSLFTDLTRSAYQQLLHEVSQNLLLTRACFLPLTLLDLQMLSWTFDNLVLSHSSLSFHIYCFCLIVILHCFFHPFICVNNIFV